MTTKLTKKEKHIATAVYPTYGGYSTWDEVREAKLKACGHYWNDNDFGEYVAFSPKGKRNFFPYDDEWKKEVSQCAKLWSQGKSQQANALYDSLWNGYVMRNKEIKI